MSQLRCANVMNIKRKMAVQSLMFGFFFLSLLFEVFGKENNILLHRTLNSSTVNRNVSSNLINDVGNYTEEMPSERDVTLNTDVNTSLSGNIEALDITAYGNWNNISVYIIPDSWLGICKVFEGEIYESEFTPRTNLISIKCTIDVNHSNILNTNDLRETLDSYKDLNKRFSLEINCRSMANISLSFPFKVDNLFILKVQGCRILDCLADGRNNVSAAIPDSLRVLQILNTTISVKQSNLNEFMRDIKTLTKGYSCLHAETIEFITMRNISYEIIKDIVSEPEEVGNHGRNIVPRSRHIPDVCDYLHLRILDRSIRTRPLFDLYDLFTERSIYERVQIYNASNSGIAELKDRYLQWSNTFPNLQMLDLSKNNISKLYRFAFPLHSMANISKFTTVDLRFNKISMITVNDLDRFKMMPTVFFDLRNNPIDCNCSDTLEELLRYIEAGKHLQISNIFDYSYIENLECNYPENLKGTTIKTLTSEMICESNLQTEYFLVPIICLSATIVILALLFLVICRFRHEITILLFTHFNIIFPCQTRDSYDSEKKYDAFVSYSSNEEEYVEKLFEDLEKPADDKARPSFKFCMHHRDFVPGKTIFDNVTFSVESSRHTIILLSNHFIKSEYCLYEFQEAFRQSIMEKRRHLVIIMMEDIPEKQLPRDLRRCVKTFTYIRKDDFLFTERLIYALSIKHERKSVIKNSEEV
ncbi:toll-like receptor 8 [Ruditapes philippinarum]|uniref:toll-like receptor 8 n=1 Tax=Ruditapes philippinarum TaxID=129788 RepID=UPI00295A93B5|nr:toll-like receptor 8 [Ruditapes philippinarum]